MRVESLKKIDTLDLQTASTCIIELLQHIRVETHIIPPYLRHALIKINDKINHALKELK
jgi:hypothetical protein